MRFKVLFIVLGLTVVLASCARVSHAPAEMSEEAKVFQVPEDRGSVYLYRTGRMVGAAGQLRQ